MSKNTACMFVSVLAPHIEAHIAEKRVLGCRYRTAVNILQRFDRFLAGCDGVTPDLDRHTVESWLERGPAESMSTQSARATCVRQFCQHLRRQGYSPFIPGKYPRGPRCHVPYIFTAQEIRSLLISVDSIREDVRSPHRREVLGIIFRLLYGCGLRVSEALHLACDDVDLAAGILRIIDTKFRKDRLIPLAEPLAERLRVYAQHHPKNLRPDDYFLGAPHGGQWSYGRVYQIFRQALWQCRIPHTGRGPRLHDLRHTFACHRLGQWIREGVDVDVALPVLSTYLGHESLYHTQRYLHFVADMYPDVVGKLDSRFGQVTSRKGHRH